ncbi:hypothetical protein QQM79_05815 [Marinobacteraceae bacterium S3BR75-40.1]
MFSKSTPPRSDAPVDPGRRGFLKAGLGTTALLATVSLGAGLSGCATQPMGAKAGETPEQRYYFLSSDDRVLLQALLPAILASSLPEDPQARREAIDATIARMDEGIYRFGPRNQAEFRRLFDLLNFAPTRVLAAGVWSSWDSVDTETANDFLMGWRDSSIGLFNNGYIALVKMTNVSYFGARENWALSGYPGPPDRAVQSLPQFQKSA